MTNYEYLVDAISAVTDDCIVWERGGDGRGYGCVTVDGKARKAHQVALDLHTPRPAGKVCPVKKVWVDGSLLETAHGPCHNRACFNPRHLSWATRAENRHHRKRDGTNRGLSNEDNAMCMIPNADVAAIFQLWEGPHRGPDGTGPLQRELADQFGCSQAQISNIVNGHKRRLVA